MDSNSIHRYLVDFVVNLRRRSESKSFLGSEKILGKLKIIHCATCSAKLRTANATSSIILGH